MCYFYIVLKKIIERWKGINKTKTQVENELPPQKPAGFNETPTIIFFLVFIIISFLFKNNEKANLELNITENNKDTLLKVKQSAPLHPQYNYTSPAKHFSSKIKKLLFFSRYYG